MEDLTLYQADQLPDTLEDLTQFVLVGQATLNAYMLKLRTVNKLSVAQEIRDQTLKEAQDVSTALIAAEQRIGEILLSIPKASGGVNQYNKEDFSGHVEKTKSETISEMGYSKDEAHDYQTMAKNPEVVQRVIEDALSRGDVVTKTQVLKEIKAAKDEAKRQAEEMQKALEDAEAELEELRQRKPETIVQRVEVVPDDYKQAKKELAALKADLKREQLKADEKQGRILELQDRINELEGVTKEGLEHENLVENVYYFAQVVNNFVGNVGGLVWLVDRIADMPKKEKDIYMKASMAFKDWALAFCDNLERRLNAERQLECNDD